MFHGHLSLPNGALGLEGFVHDGRTYTYFGLFPSIIRMPILLVTSSLDGKLTAPYMLLAWLLTGLFASLLLWRVRFLVRGDSAMGRTEATGFGVLMATIMGGTIWMLLAVDSLRLQRGHRLEHLPDRGEHLRPPRRDRTTVMGPGDRQRRPHLVREPRQVDHGVGVRGRRRSHRALVPAGSRWAGEPALVPPRARGGPDPTGHRLRRQLLQVRCPVRGLEPGAGVDARQRLPTQVSRRQPRCRGRHGLRADQHRHLFSA